MTLSRSTPCPPPSSVTRANPPINRIPQAVQLLEKTQISQARPTWGLDEALATVPGVYAANRYNFSLDQRISIRGFGARDRKSTRLNSSHLVISYAVFCLKKIRTHTV